MTDRDCTHRHSPPKPSDSTVMKAMTTAWKSWVNHLQKMHQNNQKDIKSHILTLELSDHVLHLYQQTCRADGLGTFSLLFWLAHIGVTMSPGAALARMLNLFYVWQTGSKRWNKVLATLAAQVWDTLAPQSIQISLLVLNLTHHQRELHLKCSIRTGAPRAINSYPQGSHVSQSSICKECIVGWNHVQQWRVEWHVDI